MAATPIFLYRSVGGDAVAARGAVVIEGLVIPFWRGSVCGGVSIAKSFGAVSCEANAYPVGKDRKYLPVFFYVRL